MRAFEVLTKAEYDIRGCAYPRYHLEMALLRWIHLRQLVPISRSDSGAREGRASDRPSQPAAMRQCPAAVSRRPPRRPATASPPPSRAAAPAPAAEPPRRPAPPPPRPPSVAAATVKAVEARSETAKAPAAGSEPMPNVQPVAPRLLKDAFLAEVRKCKKFFYGTVVAQAQRIDIDGDRIVFTFAPQHRALRVQLDQSARLARRARVAALESQDDGRLRRRRRTARQGRRRGADTAHPRRTASRSCASRRSPIRACRRCSTCLPPRSRMSRRCERLRQVIGF